MGPVLRWPHPSSQIGQDQVFKDSEITQVIFKDIHSKRDFHKVQDISLQTQFSRFANLQNLRRHLRLHLKRDSHLAEIDSEGEEKVITNLIVIKIIIININLISIISIISIIIWPRWTARSKWTKAAVCNITWSIAGGAWAKTAQLWLLSRKVFQQGCLCRPLPHTSGA